MSIQDQSSLNEYIARSLTLPGDKRILSAGTITEQQQFDIDARIFIAKESTTFKTTGVLPKSTYVEVAEILKPSTPGMDIPAITAVLQTNGMFNEVPTKQSNYNAISAKMHHGLNQIRNKNMTGGLMGDISNEIFYHSERSLNDVTRDLIDGNGSRVSLKDTSVTTVNSILSGTENVLFNSIPAKTRELVGPKVVRKTISTATDGIAASIGGSSAPLVNGKVDLKVGNFTVDMGSMPKGDQQELAAESIIAETGAVNADKSAITESMGELQKTLGSGGNTFETYPPPLEIGSVEIQPGSDFVSSMEELEAEMGSMTRDISEIIVHWSGTYTDANLSAEQLGELTGSGKNSYHLIIKRDGSIQRGVPMNSVGSHCPINNHDAYSIGVCLIGGLNIASGDYEIDQTGANSLTRSQFNSLYQIFRTFFNQYPGGQALGHMDTDITQDDPGFDVRDYAYNNFNKTSLYTDPLGQAALSPAEILAALDGSGPTVLTKDPDVMDKKF